MKLTYAALAACVLAACAGSSPSSSRTSSTSTSNTPSAPTPVVPSCSLSFTGNGCIQFQIDASTYARNQSGARFFDLYIADMSDLDWESKAYRCKVQTTICYGLCPGDSTRSVGSSLANLPAIPNAAVILVPRGTKGECGGAQFSNVDLTRCATTRTFAGNLVTCSGS